MALITRFVRLFRADFHAVLDRVEEPDILLRQAVREMEEELARDERSLQLRQQEGAQLTKKLQQLEQSHAALNEELDVCFNAGEEQLARSVIRRRLETERTRQLVQRRQQDVAEQCDRLTQRLNGNRTRYESMRQKAELFEQPQQNPDGVGAWPGTEARVRDEDVEVALLKERQRRAVR